MNGLNTAKKTSRILALEKRRALLRQARLIRPDDGSIRQALTETLRPEIVRQAAQGGVFISYTRQDELFALELDMMLRAAQIKVWMDEVDIPNSADWQAEVAHALQNTRVMLAVCRHNFSLNAERQHFLNAGKILLPVIAQNCAITTNFDEIAPIRFDADYHAARTELLQLLQAPSPV